MRVGGRGGILWNGGWERVFKGTGVLGGFFVGLLFFQAETEAGGGKDTRGNTWNIKLSYF